MGQTEAMYPVSYWMSTGYHYGIKNKEPWATNENALRILAIGSIAFTGWDIVFHAVACILKPLGIAGRYTIGLIPYQTTSLADYWDPDQNATFSSLLDSVLRVIRCVFNFFALPIVGALFPLTAFRLYNPHYEEDFEFLQLEDDTIQEGKKIREISNRFEGTQISQIELTLSELDAISSALDQLHNRLEAFKNKPYYSQQIKQLEQNLHRFKVGHDMFLKLCYDRTVLKSLLLTENILLLNRLILLREHKNHSQEVTHEKANKEIEEIIHIKKEGVRVCDLLLNSPSRWNSLSSEVLEKFKNPNIEQGLRDFKNLLEGLDIAELQHIFKDFPWKNDELQSELFEQRSKEIYSRIENLRKRYWPDRREFKNETNLH